MTFSLVEVDFKFTGQLLGCEWEDGEGRREEASAWFCRGSGRRWVRLGQGKWPALEGHGQIWERYLAGKMKKPLTVWAGAVREGKESRLECFWFVQLSQWYHLDGKTRKEQDWEEMCPSSVRWCGHWRSLCDI